MVPARYGPASALLTTRARGTMNANCKCCSSGRTILTKAAVLGNPWVKAKTNEGRRSVPPAAAGLMDLHPTLPTPQSQLPSNSGHFLLLSITSLCLSSAPLSFCHDSDLLRALPCPSGHWAGLNPCHGGSGARRTQPGQLLRWAMGDRPVLPALLLVVLSVPPLHSNGDSGF